MIWQNGGLPADPTLSQRHLILGYSVMSVYSRVQLLLSLVPDLDSLIRGIIKAGAQSLEYLAEN